MNEMKPWEFWAYRWIFGIKEGPEYLCHLFDVLPKQTTREVKALQENKFTFNNNFMMNRELNLAWSEMTLILYLSAAGWDCF